MFVLVASASLRRSFSNSNLAAARDEFERRLRSTKITTPNRGCYEDMFVLVASASLRRSFSNSNLAAARDEFERRLRRTKITTPNRGCYFCAPTENRTPILPVKGARPSR